MPGLVCRLICCQLQLPALKLASSLLSFCFCRYLATSLISSLVILEICQQAPTFLSPALRSIGAWSGKPIGSVDVWLEWSSSSPSLHYHKKCFDFWYNMPHEYICKCKAAIRGWWWLHLTYVPTVGISWILNSHVDFLLNLKIPKPWLRQLH